MGMQDYLKCPGLDRALISIPKDFTCPTCQGVVEIWTDETKRKCPRCGTMVQNNPTGELVQNHPRGSKYISDRQLDDLIDTAIHRGASDAKTILSSEIVIEERLASLCNADPPCESYGLSASCPPYVPGPSAFRRWQQSSASSIVVRIDLPTEIMFSSQRRGVMQLLHEIVAHVEHEAIEMGYHDTRAFAGGSCKNLFCKDQKACCITSEQGQCRNPTLARPSMSGFGIDVTKLVQSAGWPLKKTRPEAFSEKDSQSWVAGLVLISNDETDKR